MPVNRSAHARALRYSTLTLCFVLVLAGMPFDTRVNGQNNPNANQDGPRTKGAPGPNLPNLDQKRAEGARDEPQPEIKPQRPTAATRCRHNDRICKETKEKKIGFVPSDDRFSGMLAHNSSAEVFAWNAKPAQAFLPALDTLLTAHPDAQPDLTPSAQPSLSHSSRTDKAAKPLPRAYASSFFPAAVQGAGNWETARVDEINRTGTGGEDLYSGNYNWNLPLVNLPGRAGHDLNLTLSYNSLIWLKWGSQVRFDHDWSQQSPGFHLGFPTFQGPYYNTQTNLESYQMFTPSGRVVELRKNGTGIYDARDGSLTRLTINGSGPPVLTTTDGTTYTYGTTLDIKDRNGNLITVSYNAVGLYGTITDTLGRVITFNYGAYNDLQTITQTWDNLTKTLVTFHYDNSFQLFPAFSGVTPENVTSGQYVPVIYQVDFLDGTHFNFQYNNYGQIWRIERKGANYNLRATTVYDLPISGGSPTDCPRFTKRTDWAVDWSPTNGYDTNFCFSDAACAWTANHLVGKVTTPDGTTQRLMFADYAQPNSAWKRGLTVQSETWSGGIKKKWTTLAWENAGILYQLNPRINETNVYDEANNRRRTYIDYWDYTYNLPSYVTEYNADATTVLRYTLTNYNNNSQYLSRRLIGLPTERTLYDGSNALQSKVQYVYDETGYLQAHATQPIRHDSTGSGNSSAGNYGLTFNYRGNVTTMRRYNVTDSSYVENKTGYYITGNPAYTKNPRDLQNIPQTQTTFDYNGTYLTDAGYPETRPNTYAYPGSVTDPDGFTSTFIYHFDRGDLRRAIDPKGAQMRRDYDGMGRMWKVLNETNGAYTRYNFDTNHNYVQSYSTINDATEFYAITTFDGHGRTRANASEHPGSTTNFKGQYTGYDNMGRVYQQSNPAEMNGSTWNPAGDDSAGWAWSYQTYDWQGRPLVTTNQDTTTKTISYDGCGCAGGQTITIKDEGDGVLVNGQPRRRQQKLYHDVLGRLKKTEVLDWNGAVYSTTVNTYNVRDQLTFQREFQGNTTPSQDSATTCPSSTTCQLTKLVYDGHARLKERWLPIYCTPSSPGATTCTQTAPYDSYTYNADDTVLTMTDPRGASSTYGYNNRQLTTSVSYAVAINCATQPTNPSCSFPASNVTLGYDAAGNRDWMKDGTEPAGQYAVDYVYDTLSRLQSETRRFNDFSANTYQLAYNYNLAGELKDMTYSKNSQFDSSVSYAYDKAGQLLNVTGAGFGGVSQFTSTALPIKYRAWGAVKQMNYGNGLQTAHTYNARLQLARRTFTPVSSVAADNDYAYYPDGRLKSRLLFNSPSDFDRLYSYDHAARLIQGRTAGEARGLTGSGPYHQDYVYDVWGNLGRTNNTLWGHAQPTDTPTYTNNRHPGNFYDNAGNVTVSGGVTHSYDAASRQTVASGGGYVGGPPPQPTYPVWEIANNYDGDGLYVKRAETRRYPNPQGVITTNYYVRSSVLGGALLVELNAQGNKAKSYVYAAGSRLAKHEPANATAPVAWYVTEPLTGDWGEAKSNGDFLGDRGANLDPLGAEVPPNDPYLLDPTPTYIESRPNEPLYIDGGDPFDLSGGCPDIDGMPVSCSEFRRRAGSGSLAGQLTFGGANIGAPKPLELRGGVLYASSSSLPGTITGMKIMGRDGSLWDQIADSVDDLPLTVWGHGGSLFSWQQGGGQRRGGGHGGDISNSVQNTPLPKNSIEAQLADCYSNILKAYDRITDGDTSYAMQAIRLSKKFAIFGLATGLSKFASGAYEAAGVGRDILLSRQGTVLLTSPPNRSIGAILKGGANKVLSVGKTGATRVTGLALTGLGSAIALEDALQGPEAFLREGIQDCNNAHPNAQGRIDATFGGALTGSNAGNVRAYVSKF